MASNDVGADATVLLHRLNYITNRLKHIFWRLRNLERPIYDLHSLHNFTIIPLLKQFHRLVRAFGGLPDCDSYLEHIDAVYYSFRVLTELIRRIVEEAAEAMVDGLPANREAVESLVKIIVSGDRVNEEESECSICTEAFELGDDARQMPCHKSHIFHSQCLLPWLARRNTCPICRAPLLTPSVSSSAFGFPGASEEC